jgi:hypothetical protein
MDHRQHFRSSPPGLAFVKIEPGMGGTMVDLSEGGLGFRIIMPLLDDAGPVKISFSLDAKSLLEASGELAWSDSSRQKGGVRFTDLGDEVRRQLREFLSRSVPAVDLAAAPEVSSPPCLSTFTAQAIQRSSARRVDQSSSSAPTGADVLEGPAASAPALVTGQNAQPNAQSNDQSNDQSNPQAAPAKERLDAPPVAYLPLLRTVPIKPCSVLAPELIFDPNTDQGVDQAIDQTIDQTTDQATESNIARNVAEIPAAQRSPEVTASLPSLSSIAAAASVEIEAAPSGQSPVPDNRAPRYQPLEIPYAGSPAMAFKRRLSQSKSRPRHSFRELSLASIRNVGSIVGPMVARTSRRAFKIAGTCAKISANVTSKFATRRMRVLSIVMGTLLVVSVAPLWLYHRHVLRLSEANLEDTERIQQQESARAIAGEILQFQSNLREQLTTQRQFMALTGWSDNVEDPTHAPQVSRLLHSIVEGNPDIIYVTAVGRQAQGGESAGSDRVDNDPFVYATLKRAFTASTQEVNFVSEPFAVGSDKRPALVMSVPLFSDGKFTGMLAAVVSLDRVVARLRDVSTHDRVFFIVDAHRRIVAHTGSTGMISGMDASKNSLVVSKFEELPQDQRTTGTVVFDEKEKGHNVEMIGTYSTIPALQWAVIAQRSLEQARVDAGVKDLTAEAVRCVMGATFVALLFGCLFAFGITLQNLTRVIR